MEHEIIQLILQNFKDNKEKNYFTTEYIANKLEKQRSNVSAVCNSMVDRNILLKIKTKPVLFLPYEKVYDSFELPLVASTMTKEQWDMRVKKKENENFSKLIGNDGSLKNAINQAKAAILYPPNGLNILLFGESGTGKTTFSRMLYEFALKENILTHKNKFIVLNCAEYADNPQLLLDILMGHVKGAYTGAADNSLGLIGETNNGILFLDEVHRLPKEGQEMLFTVIDRGEYRPLGETNKVYKTNVRIICATTEPLDSFLLTTFKRRIPVIIELPSLTEKDVSERLSLILNFFYQEACSIGEKLIVKKEVLLALLQYPCSGNIGELENDIRLLCAKSFLEFRTSRAQHYVQVTKNNLTHKVFQGLLQQRESRNVDEVMVKRIKETVIDPSDNNFLSVLPKTDNSFYTEIDNKIQLYMSQGLSNQKMLENLERDIEILERRISNIGGINKGQLFSLISKKIYYILQEVLSEKYSESLILALAFHLSALTEHFDYNTIYKTPLTESHVEISEPVNMIRHRLFKELRISVPESELSVIEGFLKTKRTKKFSDKILILCHGKSTATSLTEVVNSLTGQQICFGYDMQLTTNIQDAQKEVLELVRQINVNNELLIFADMGSLMNFGNEIAKRLNIEVKTIVLGNILQILEIARKYVNSNKDLLVASEEMGLTDYSEIQESEVISNRPTIIVSCMTGKGAAKAIKNFLVQRLGLENLDEIEIVTLSKKVDAKRLEKKYRKIIFTTGTFNIHIKNVQFISIEKLNNEKVIEILRQLIRNEILLDKVLIQQNGIKDVVTNFATDDMMPLIDKYFDYFEKKYETLSKIMNVESDAFSVKLPFLMHLIHLIVRIKNDDIQNDNFECKMVVNSKVEMVFADIEQKMKIVIPKTEKDILVKILMGE